jgi:hypothetical protein
MRHACAIVRRPVRSCRIRCFGEPNSPPEGADISLVKRTTIASLPADRRIRGKAVDTRLDARTARRNLEKRSPTEE